MRGLGGVTVFAGSRASTVNAASEPGSSPHCWELHQAAGDHTAESVSDGVGGGYSNELLVSQFITCHVLRSIEM